MTYATPLALILAAFVIAGCGARASSQVVKGESARPHRADVCLLAGGLPGDYKYRVIGKINATKRSYGGTDELMPVIANEARKIGADAVIELQADQRFKGPLPWRVVSPTGTGSAIVIENKDGFDCAKAGGKSA